MPSRLNKRNFNRQHCVRGQSRGPSPPPLRDPPLTGPDGPEDPADDPQLSWYFGQDAGGFQIPFGKHTGKLLNEVPYPYIRWCRDNLQKAWTLLNAIEKYIEGLKAWMSDGNFGEVTVPIGKTYKGLPLKNCRDKEWMQWLMDKAPQKLKDRHELFFLAIEGWLENPPHQLAHRDLGESLSKSKYWDELNLSLEEDEEYDDDADENGDLEGFVVPDDDEEVGSGNSDSDEEEGGPSTPEAGDLSNELDERKAQLAGTQEGDEDAVSFTPSKASLKRKRDIIVALDDDAEPDYGSSPLKRLRRRE